MHLFVAYHDMKSQSTSMSVINTIQQSMLGAKLSDPLSRVSPVNFPPFFSVKNSWSDVLTAVAPAGHLSERIRRRPRVVSTTYVY